MQPRPCGAFSNSAFGMRFLFFFFRRAIASPRLGEVLRPPRGPLKLQSAVMSALDRLSCICYAAAQRKNKVVGRHRNNGSRHCMWRLRRLRSSGTARANRTVSKPQMFSSQRPWLFYCVPYQTFPFRPPSLTSRWKPSALQKVYLDSMGCTSETWLFQTLN